MDIHTPYGLAREQHLAAAKRIYQDMVKRAIERQVLVQRAKRIESLSPAAGMLLRDWMQAWNKSCEGLKAMSSIDAEYDSNE